MSELGIHYLQGIWGSTAGFEAVCKLAGDDGMSKKATVTKSHALIDKGYGLIGQFRSALCFGLSFYNLLVLSVYIHQHNG